MSALFPEGINTLADLPHTIHDAIVVGLQFLRFQEMDPEEAPPRSIWLDQDKLTAHFKAVEKRREEKYGTDKDGNSKEIEDPVQNDAARLLMAPG